MKRIDYLCLLYSVILLAFGFDDNPRQGEQRAAKTRIDNQSYAKIVHETPENQLSAREQMLAAGGTKPFMQKAMVIDGRLHGIQSRRQMSESLANLSR